MKSKISIFLAIIMILSLCACGNGNGSSLSADDSSGVIGEKCNHEYKEEVIQPQCSTDGYTKHLCSVCGDEYISDIVYATGHSFSEWKTETESTCKAEGKKSRSCSVCAYEENEKIALSSHNYKELSEENDKLTYKCEICDRTVVKTDKSELSTEAEKTLFDCDKNQVIKVSFNGNVESLKNKLDIIPLMYEGTERDVSGGSLVEFSADNLGNGVFSLKPSVPFDEGGCYVIRLKSNDVSFTDYPEFGRIIIRVKSEEKFDLEINENIKFIKSLNDQNPGYYPYSVTASEGSGIKYVSLMKVDGLNVGDVVCLGEYSDMSDVLQNGTLKNDYCFGKISKIYPAEVGYVLTLTETEAGDIYTKADISYTTGIIIEEENLTSEEKENIKNAALTSVLNDDAFVTYLAATESAATEYLLSRGLEPAYESLGTWGPKDIAGFNFKADYEFDNTQVKKTDWEPLEGNDSRYDFKIKKSESGTKIKVTLTVSREFKAKTASGSDAGTLDISITLSFVCEPKIKLEYLIEDNDFWDYPIMISAELISSNEFTLDFQVHAGIDYSLENKPYVYNYNTGTYHCAYCRIYEMNKDESEFGKLTLDAFVSQTKDLDESSKAFCGVCKPQTDLKDDTIVVNEKEKTVHIHGCSHITDSCIIKNGLASKYKLNGYSMCMDCEPEKQQSESFREIINNKIKSGGLEKEAAALKDILKENGAVESGTAKEGKSLIKAEIPCSAIFKLMVQLDLVVDFDLNASIQYKYTAKSTTRAFVNYWVDGTIECGKEEYDKTTTQTVDFMGTSRASLGVNFSIGVAVVAEDVANVKLTLSIGVYAKLNGMFHCDITQEEWHGGAYFEAGMYVGVNASASILWYEFPIPIVETTDVPFFKLGYDEIWIEFITKPTTAEMIGNLFVMNEEDYLKVKTYSLTEMKSGERTLSLNGGNHYDVNVTFGHGSNYLTGGSSGVYKVSEKVTGKFIETVTISVESKSDWKNYKKGQAAIFLEPYTFSVAFEDDYLLDESDVSVGDIITFGKYEQDNITSNGKEDIEWQVLEVKNGKALIISKYGLDAKPYNETRTSVTWETCTLREWLNDDFYNTAFSSSEKAKIKSTTVINADNSYFGTEGGNNTTDKVFLLSIEEAITCFFSDEDRECEATSYAKANGAYVYEGHSWWWLRSPSGSQDDAAYVYTYGIVIHDVGFCVSNTDGVVRPVLWMSIDEIEDTDNGEPEKPDNDIGSVSVGDIITFGKYEQDNITSNGKEDIEWQVLEVKNGKALIISKYGLDAKPYNEEWKAVTWETCTLRSWLNNDFYNTAFSSLEKAKIKSTTLINADNPYYGTEGGNNTTDKVFLLSIDEAIKYYAPDQVETEWTDYYKSTNRAASCEATSYAKVNGADVTSSNGCYWWWLRSPGTYQLNAASVYNSGHVDSRGRGVSGTYSVVRPALWISLES